MSAIATLFSILTSIYAGRLPDRFGRAKPFILSSFLLSGVILFALSQVVEVILFQALYILLEVSNSIYVPSTRILIAETYQRAEWRQMFARHNLIVGLGSTMGLAICSMLVSSVGYGTLLSLCAPLVFVSFLVAFFVIKDPPLYVGRWLSRIGRSVDDVETLSFWFGSKGFRLKPTVDMTLFGVGTVIFAIASSSALLSLPIYLSDIILMTPSMTFAVFIFPSLFGALSSVIFDRWFSWRRVGNAIKVASFARAELILLFISLAFSSFLAPIAAVVLLSALSFSFSIYSVDRSTIIMDYSAEGTVGVHGALNRFGIVIGRLLSGLVPMIFGFNLLFITASLLSLISFTFFWKSIS
jgi:MFS family permease